MYKTENGKTTEAYGRMNEAFMPCTPARQSIEQSSPYGGLAGTGHSDRIEVSVADGADAPEDEIYHRDPVSNDRTSGSVMPSERTGEISSKPDDIYNEPSETGDMSKGEGAPLSGKTVRNLRDGPAYLLAAKAIMSCVRPYVPGKSRRTH